MQQVDKSSRLYRIRHSLAHVLAQAMQQFRPGATLGFGPPVDDGFYYDFTLPEPISDEDLPKLQKLMRKILKQKQEFVREELAPADAYKRLEEMREPYKVEYAKELVEKEGNEKLSFYRNGPFVDMCEGPHVENTREIPQDAFALSSVAGAYWRGDERNPMMVRVYGWAFETKEELEKYKAAREEALKRDHRKLGAELDLFVVDDDVGKGLPLWLPAGAVICDELEKLAEEWEFREGYVRVRTPHVAKDSLYRTSGHLSLFKKEMYPPMLLEEEEGEGERSAYYLKPMNCPHHHKIFAARLRSYRDLPLRLAEYGTVYRYEKSGALQGLTRVRGMTMNDAHMYITEDQVREEFVRVMDLHRRYYELFGFSDYYLRFSLWDPEDPKKGEKYVSDPEAWEKTQEHIRRALEEVGLPHVEVTGEAAFYGPKVDYQFHTVGLREFTASTNQLDFASAKRFSLFYTDKDGTQKHPYIIHRAPLGTHERFVAFLIEHYGGAFPTWLAPIQVRLLPVSERFSEYANKVCAALREQLVRAECDDSDERLAKKIRLGTTRKIPILCIVGEKEESQDTVTVRRYGIEDQRSFKIAEFVDQVQREIRARKHVQNWDDV